MSISKRYHICFLVTANRTGVAGHHFSVRDISHSLSAAVENVDILEIRAKGDEISRPLSKVNNFKSFQLNSLAPRQWINLYKHFKSESYDAIFCFDEFSVRVGIIFNSLSLNKVVPVKPGWINSKSWTSACAHFINFSKENFDYFKGQPKYSKVNLHHIPNRVQSVEPALDLIRDLKESLNILPNQKIIIAASRISKGDERDSGKRCVFESALELYKLYKLDQQGWRIVVLGTPVNDEASAWILNLCEDFYNVSIVTSNKYTENLSTILPMADVVFAMGRTAMEAMSAGTAVIIPTEDLRNATLVDGLSFERLQNFNFTHRFKINNVCKNINEINGLSKIFFDMEYLDHVKRDTKELFINRLSLKRAIFSYINIIEDISAMPRRSNFKKYVYSFVRVWLLQFLKILRTN